VPLIRLLSRFSGVLLTVLLVAPAAANAAQITGNPLTVSSADDTGRLGAAYTGSTETEFYGSSVDTATGAVSAGNAGFVVTTVDQSGALHFYGSRRGNVTPTSAPAVTGSGSAADPFRLVQTFRGDDGSGAAVDIRQEIDYVTGQSSFDAKLTVTNISNQSLQLRASMGADLTGGGNDVGAGLFQGGPPRFVAGVNPTVGSIAGLSEVTSWSHYEEGAYGEVLSRAEGDPRSVFLKDTVDPSIVDNGAAVQWDARVGTPLPPGQSVDYAVTWKFARPYNLTPENQTLSTGDTATFTVSTQNASGGPQAGTRIRYAVIGSNNLTGNVLTGANGQATFEYIGANPGEDSVSAYADLNNNGQRDDGEPQRQATVIWNGPPPPTFAQEVNVRPVSGVVLVKLPKNARVKGKWAQAAQARFVPLTDAKQIPIGSELDTSRGRVSLTSSKSPSGGVQTAQFYSGRFQTMQPASEKGLTELRMTQPLSCVSSKKRGKLSPAAAKRRTRQLWGNGKGRFRTRGRNSSATVRGTVWVQKDTCTTTTTVVRQGTVVVRDFVKRKNITVKAGHRYVARARKR
jgi:hypothetical protein